MGIGLGLTAIAMGASGVGWALRSRHPTTLRLSVLCLGLTLLYGGLAVSLFVTSVWLFGASAPLGSARLALLAIGVVAVPALATKIWRDYRTVDLATVRQGLRAYSEHAVELRTEFKRSSDGLGLWNLQNLSFANEDHRKILDELQDQYQVASETAQSINAVAGRSIDSEIAQWRGACADFLLAVMGKQSRGEFLRATIELRALDLGMVRPKQGETEKALRAGAEWLADLAQYVGNHDLRALNAREAERLRPPHRDQSNVYAER